jgi:hypothetical protein
MKAQTLISISATMFGLFLSDIAFAQTVTCSSSLGCSVTSTISALETGDLSEFGLNSNSMQLTGVTSMGSCKTSPFNGAVILYFKDDLHGQQMYATALAAATAGQSISVSTNPSSSTGILENSSGYCFIQTMGIANN